MEIQKGSSGGFLAERASLRTSTRWIAQKQRGQALDQGLGVQVAPQQVQGVVFDRMEGNWNPLDILLGSHLLPLQFLYWCGIASDLLIGRQQCYALDQRLRDQQPVEGVFVQWRQSIQGNHMLTADR